MILILPIFDGSLKKISLLIVICVLSRSVKLRVAVDRFSSAWNSHPQNSVQWHITLSIPSVVLQMAPISCITGNEVFPTSSICEGESIYLVIGC
jgi:hypothetical protein